MDLSVVFTWLTSMWDGFPALFQWLGLLVIVGQGVAAITPTKKDDNFFAKMWDIPVLGTALKAIAAFAPLQKKDKV